MKWNFLGFENWPPASGSLDILQGFDVFRATCSENIPRSMCEGCICWREFGTCAQVQVNDFESDARMRRQHAAFRGGTLPGGCLIDRNCCPILFFAFIGRPLPVLDVEANTAATVSAPSAGRNTVGGLVGGS